MQMNTFVRLPRRRPRRAAHLLVSAMLLAPAAVLSQAPAATPAPAIAPSAGPGDTPTSANLPAPTVRSGTFKSVEGDVAVVRDRTRSTPAPGAPLQPGDRIATGATGSAIVTLRDGTVLTVGPNSVVELSRYAFEPTTQRGNFLVDLFEGSIRVVTGLLARVNPELFRVNTPTSVVGVRGTDFIVEAEPNPAVRKALP
jgi:FecR protein